MRLLSSIQEIIIKKSVNNIVYDEGLHFTKNQSSISKQLGIDYWNMITDPPANDSIETNNDLATVIKMANNRTSQETDLVYLVDKDPVLLYSSILKSNNLEFPYDEFRQLYDFLKPIILDLKYLYNRARPYQLAKFYGIRLNMIHTKTHQTPSYPSGHMAYGCLAASVLSDKYPEHTNHFWKINEQCGLGRVLQGVHFLGDNEASKILVKGIYSKLKNLNTKFIRSKV